ncbi:MAG: hypothetical protein JJE18_07395 [Eubacteriaceae bacterium]|nr:hypothetical protein [Eubacteriaceae bacterium]
MLKPLSKWIFLGFILIFTLVAGGCQSLFIPKNVPIVLWNGLPSNTQASPQITIPSYNTVANGTIQDITNSGNALLILNSGNPAAKLNIDSFNTDTRQLSPFISSDKRKLSARYDALDSGIYYVEEANNPITGNNSSQLLWTDINRDTTRIISLPEENVVKYFGIGKSNQVVYCNTNNKIIMADNQGNRQVYKTSQNYNILSVDYMINARAFVFIATAPTGAEQTNLYYAEINPNSFEIIPKIVDENVIDFDINNGSNQLIYVNNIGEKQSIGSFSIYSSLKTTVSTGNFRTAKYTPNGNKIIYTQYSPKVDSQSQSIWIMDANGNNPFQVTLPLKLNSQVISHPSKSILYFSVDTTTEDGHASSDGILSQTYQLNYQIE